MTLSVDSTMGIWNGKPTRTLGSGLKLAAPVACKPASETKQPIKEKLLPIFSTRPHFNFAPMRASANHTMAWLLITALLLNPEVAGEGVRVSADSPLVLES